MNEELIEQLKESLAQIEQRSNEIRALNDANAVLMADLLFGHDVNPELIPELRDLVGSLAVLALRNDTLRDRLNEPDARPWLDLFALAL
ncbi:hypothetical protein Pan44_27070 [Caulifigura coniformis]|uniref:FlgN protein n=1 Tax=Caulifigura coniformis TaxID=2527983 RepID=A0A517SEW5_9PLAN|nr:hypothetical protein [Caulifigura coniformis]QDT54672.1 hypothetical protein Pan44_27070 [Caulifigura coniformis]